MSIVTEALSAEYVRQRNKLKGAVKRLDYAMAQATAEESNVHKHTEDMRELELALKMNGGHVPKDDGEEPYVDEPS
jgi:hypothetical protein